MADQPDFDLFGEVPSEPKTTDPRVLNKYHFGNKVPPHAVNIMRGSIFGNPFPLEDFDGDRVKCLQKYETYLDERTASDPAFAKAVLELHDRDVCCCCAPKLCHGQPLRAKALELKRQQDMQMAALNYPTP